MIGSVEIARFRGIREGKLSDLTPLVALVGPNGCGKSSVLDALLVAGSRPTSEGLIRAVQRHEGVKYGARWLFCRGDAAQTCQLVLSTDGTGRRSCTLRGLNLSAPDKTSLKCEVVDGFEKQSSGTVHVTFRVGNDAVNVRESKPGTPAEAFPGVRLIEGYREDASTPLHRLVTETTELGTIGDVVAILSQVVPDAKDIRILTEGNDPLVHVVLSDHSVPVALTGDGVRSLVRLSLELAARRGGTVLMEEPEVHQHPGAIRRIARTVLTAVRRGIQVIFTTHSLELIDSFLAESTPDDLGRISLYRLQLEAGLLRSRRMSGSEIEFARTQIENDLR